MPSRKEHLQVLGLPLDADKADVKAAFRRLAFKTHPDLCVLLAPLLALQCLV